MRTLKLVAILIVVALGTTSVTHAAVLPGFGAVSGSVVGPKDRIVRVYLYNEQKSVGYAVFAVEGKYRAVDLIPGRYQVTVRTDGVAMDPVSIDVAANARVTANLAPRTVTAGPTYTGGLWYYPNSKVVTYDKVYPAGEGRAIVERTCIVCHGVNWLPSLHFPRPAWQAYVHYMTSEPPFRKNNKAGASLMDPALISDHERDVLLDYLAANFGPDSEPRAVQQDEEPAVDRASLAKAMFIEYRLPNTKDLPNRFTQEVHFDANGNVFATSPSRPASIVRIDPRTGDQKLYFTPNPASHPHGLTVDKDGTVWWAGGKVFVAHLDPATGLSDEYKGVELGSYGQTVTFAPNGDLWFSIIIGNKLGHWERASDKVTYYVCPAPRGRPYGTIIDHEGKIWYAEWIGGAVVRFDPETKTFKRFMVKSQPAMMRRLGVDSKNIIWYGVYGRVGKNGMLGRLDPKTGEIIEYELPIQYANPYDAWADSRDNIWISADNYLTKFEPGTRRFTVYPVPERTDMPKIMTTQEGAVWYAPRGAGWGGYGGAAAVLYPDMDAITTLGAYYPDGDAMNHISRYSGPRIPVTGKTLVFKDGPQNPDMPGERTVGYPMEAAGQDRTDTYNNRNVEGGG